jgi:SAM-dependent methyltransferase
MVLDAGCGEGKNAIHLARLGAKVRGIDICPFAIDNARKGWPDASLVDWEVADIRTVPMNPESFAIVVAYGLLHCLDNAVQICDIVRRLQAATLPGGYNVVCVFNERFQDLRGHPGFEPTLMRHSWYLSLYEEWEVLHESDQDLHESHPHNGVPHVHSMTRLLARKGHHR